MYIQNISCLGMVSGFVEVGTRMHFGQKDKGLTSNSFLENNCGTLSTGIMHIVCECVRVRVCMYVCMYVSVSAPDNDSGSFRSGVALVATKLQ